MKESASPSVNRLLSPRSIAIVGASADPLAPGARVLANLDLVGFPGDVHLVSRRATEIGGRRCVPTIEDLPPGIDAAVLVVPEAAVADSVASCVKRGIGGAVVYAAGFAEVGEEGRARQDRIAAIAREGGLALNGPNCMGFTNFIERVSFSFGAVETSVLKPGVGGAAVIAQSGAMMGNIAVALGAKGVKINYTISTGNEAVNGAEDFMALALEDGKTTLIVLFMEQIRRPARFLELVGRANELGTPVLLMHPGSTGRARQAAHSHTGALAGDHAVMEAVMRHSGVVLVQTMDELFDVGMMLARWPKGAERGAAIVSNSGAVRGISLDFCEGIGLEIPAFSPATVAALRPIIPAYITVDNPLDLATAGMGQADIYGQVSRIMLTDENVGCAIMTMVPGTKQLQMAKGHSLIPVIESETRPVAFAMMGDEVPLEDDFNALVAKHQIPLFRSPDRAMRAMGHLYAHGKRRLVLKAERSPAQPRPISLPGSGTIPEYRAKACLAGLGIGVPRGELATGIEAAQTIAVRIGFPVVMKVQAASIAHKSDIGGVIAGIADAAGVASAWTTLQQRAGATKLDGILVEEMCKFQVEMIVGAKRDAEWGPMLLVGMGGIWTEALGDIRLMPADVSPTEIEAEIRLLKGARILGGLRGSPALDVAAAARVAATLGELMLGNPSLDEIEINPLVLRPVGQGAMALDALMHIHVS